MANRTVKGIQNSKVALIYYIISMILGFVSRKVFLDHIGAEILGLNTTAQNLLGFLNLAELGIGSAIAFTLYKPLAQKDNKTVSEIITVQGWLYSRIATFVAIGAAILMCFFPLIFKNSGLPLWYAYTSFGLFLYSSLLTYYTNYKQIILSANQEEYKITYSYKFVLLGQSVIQIITISLFTHGYLWWLAIQFLGATTAAWNLNRVIRKDYPELRVNLKEGKELSKKYPVIIEKVKQLFVHKLAGFALTQTSPLVIYAYTSLVHVALYGNYMLIINSITMMFTAVFNGVTAGVGNLVAEGNKKRIMDVFQELFSARFFFVAIFCFCIYELINPFMKVWLGDQYILPMTTVSVMIGIMYIMMTRTTVDAFISAYGLYKDIYAPLVEAAINLSLSILLGKYFGITGVLSGVLISLVCVVFLWKPFFVFKYALKEPLWIYIVMYLKHIVAFSTSAIACHCIFELLSLEITNYLQFAYVGLSMSVVLAIILYVALYLLTPGMKFFTKRVLKL